MCASEDQRDDSFIILGIPFTVEVKAARDMVLKIIDAVKNLQGQPDIVF